MLLDVNSLVLQQKKGLKVTFWVIFKEHWGWSEECHKSVAYYLNKEGKFTKLGLKLI